MGVILSYWTDPDATCAVEWAAELGVPAVVMVGGSDLMVLAENPARRTRMTQTLRRADHVVTIGSTLADRVASLGVATDRITPLMRGVNRNMFSPGDRSSARATLDLPADRPIVLWVGRMVPVKGLTHLLEAMATPSMRSVKAVLVLVGDGPLRGSLEAQARRLGLGDSVRFAGSVDHAALPTWYRAADLTVLPSLSEGIPNVLMESLACGTGFVASDVGSIREVSDAPERDLVAPGDSDALARRLADRLRAPEASTVRIPDVLESAATLARVLSEA
jgi:glycosyltransferase involved in cell wall biosynthesis